MTIIVTVYIFILILNDSSTIVDKTIVGPDVGYSFQVSFGVIIFYIHFQLPMFEKIVRMCVFGRESQKLKM